MQNARPCEHSRRKRREAKVEAIAGQRPEVLPPVSQHRLARAASGQLLDRLVYRLVACEGIRLLAPQRFAHRRITVPSAVESLLSTVVEAGNSQQREQTPDPEEELVFKLRRIVGRAEEEALAHIVIVQKRHEKSACLTVRTEDAALDLLAMLVHPNQRGRRGHPLRHRRQNEKKRKIQRRIDTDQVRILGRVAADETGDLLFVVEDLAVREEILLPDAQRELAHRITKRQRELRLDKL